MGKHKFANCPWTKALGESNGGCAWAGYAERHRLGDFKVRPEKCHSSRQEPTWEGGFPQPLLPTPEALLTSSHSFPFPFFLLSFLPFYPASCFSSFLLSTHPPNHHLPCTWNNQIFHTRAPLSNCLLSTTYWPWSLPQKGLDLCIHSCSRNGNSVYPTWSLRGFKSAKPVQNIISTQYT